jgi:hypothetical protein
MAGRGTQQKTFAELKGEFASDVVPTNHYGANSAWQRLSILAHNLMRGFQLYTTLAASKARSRKRTYAHRIASMKNLRFLLINAPHASLVLRATRSCALLITPPPKPSITASPAVSRPKLFSD